MNDGQILAPIAVLRRRIGGLPFQRRRAPGIRASIPCRGADDQMRLNRKIICTAATMTAEIVIHSLAVCTESGMNSMLLSYA